MLKPFLNNYFGFNRQQRNGLLVLILFSFLLLLIRIVYPFFIQPDEIVIKDLPLFERKIDSTSVETKDYPNYNAATDKRTSSLFVFDPNKVSRKQLLELGFKEKTAAIFIKYRSKGFVFKEKKDLKKVYGISDKFYLKLEPYISIEKTELKKPVEKIAKQEVTTQPSEKPQQKIELNSADSVSLISLNGIGPSFAKRILKYRNILGGYSGIDQLKEVYGFTEELFEKVKPFVSADAGLITKIDLNKDDFKKINKHPYLSYELTKTIFDLRRQTIVTPVNFKEMIDDAVLYEKILPYLKF